MLRALIVGLVVLAVAAPAASAANFTADPGTASAVITQAANTSGASTVTLAAGNYAPLTVPALGSDRSLMLLGSGAGTVLNTITINGGSVTLRRLAASGQVTAVGNTPLNLRIDNALLNGGVNATAGAGPDSVLIQQVTALGNPLVSNGGVTFNVKNSILGVAPSGSSINCLFTGLPATATQLSCTPAAGNGGNMQNPSPVTDLFVNPTDFHLRAGSPAIDRGSGTGIDVNTESSTDLDGNPRIVAYDDCTNLERDLGAFETPSTTGPPLVAISGPTTGVQGQSSTFSMVGPGAASVSDAQWAFNDGGTAVGAVVPHAWVFPGTFTVTLTARIPNGCTSVTTSTVVVSAANAPPPPPDLIPPRLTNLKLSSKSFKSGTNPKLTIHVSETTTVVATVMRRDPGVFVKGKCVARKKGRKGKGCQRDHALTHAGFRISQGTHKIKLSLGKLKAGPYVLELTSTDLSGNTGKPARLSFTVKKK